MILHPEFNIDSLLQSDDPYFNLDYRIGTAYAFGGLLCKMAEDKGGLPAIKKLFAYPNTTHGLYLAIYDTFGVKKADVGTWLRKEMRKYAG